MATITFGGGPVLSARKEFCNLKDGTQVPGYRGYIPHLKYAIGKTYGNDTHDLSQGDDTRHLILPSGNGLSSRTNLQNKLPSANGDRKLIKEMKPGYTGIGKADQPSVKSEVPTEQCYIPRRPFKYGDTYKVDCDYCIDEHLSNMKKQENQHQGLVHATRSISRLQPVNQDPTVRDHLNTYRDAYPGRPILMEDKRAPTEPPIPGYRGYIPRIGQTELGLGNRYNTTTRLGFEAFYAQTQHDANKNNQPIDIRRATSELGSSVTGAAPYTKRIYPSAGMIPKYTGYVPQRRYQFGNTYGDTTRSLDVCAHPKDCFGDYLNTQPKARSSFVC